jgi:hypothetical protein
MNNVIGFTVFNKVTGKEMATFPLTIPIGSTIEAYERDGHSVTWRRQVSNVISFKTRPIT